MYSPAFNQQMAQLEQEYAQRKASLMQNFYSQPQGSWQQPAQPPTQNVDWIRVSGIEGAKNQIVQPGNTAWMMDNNAPYFYVKSVDAVGSCDFKVFQFAEVTEQPQADPSQYVQRGEFDALKAMVEEYTTTHKKPPVKAKEADNG